MTGVQTCALPICVYIGSVSQANEVVTEGGSAVLTNKTINDYLYFTNPATVPNDGEIYVDNSTEDFTINAITANLNLGTYGYGDINLNAGAGVVNVSNQLKANANIIVPAIYGSTYGVNDGGLYLYNANESAGIYITPADNIELDRKSTRLNSSHIPLSRMPSSA